jgi:hypothetical protein
VEQPELFLGCHDRVEHAHLVVEMTDVHLIPEGVNTILAKGMIVESVAA